MVYTIDAPITETKINGCRASISLSTYKTVNQNQTGGSLLLFIVRMEIKRVKSEYQTITPKPCTPFRGTWSGEGSKSSRLAR